MHLPTWKGPSGEVAQVDAVGLNHQIESEFSPALLHDVAGEEQKEEVGQCQHYED